MLSGLREFRPEALAVGYVRWLVDHRRAALAVALVLLVPCAIAAGKLRVNNTITTWFLEDDPGLQAYWAYQKVFGNDEVVVIAVRHPGSVFQRELLEKLRAVSRRIGAQRHVERVLSLATATSVESEPEGLSVRSVLPETGPADVAAARAKLASDPLFSGNIVSADLKTTLVLVQMKAVKDIDAARSEALIEIRQVLDEELGRAGITYAMGGVGVIYDALNRITLTEGGVLITLSYVLIIVSMMLILRNWRFAALGLVVVCVTVTYTMGLYGLMGHALNMVTVILPSMLLVIVVADFVHVVMHFYHVGPVPKDPRERRQAVIERVGYIALPCFYTSCTNAVGFLALGISPISLVRDLGLYGGLGSFLEWQVTIPTCALVLYWMHPVEDFHPTAPEGWMQRFLAWLTEGVMTHRRQVWAFILAVTALSLLGMTRLVVDTYTIGYFRESHRVRRDHEFIEKNFGYYIPVELTVTAAPGHKLTEPELLGRLEKLEKTLTAEPVISRTFSIVPLVKRVHQALHGGSASQYRLPATSAEAAQELLVYEMDPEASLDQYVTKDRTFGRVSGRMKMTSVRPGKELMERLGGRLQSIFGGLAHVDFAGYLPLYVKIIDYLVQSQIQSFALAFLFVFGPMYVIFWSVRLTFISIVPNVLPVGITLGAMGWLGIPLDVATITIAAIILGLVVDDTIHFLHGFRWRHAEGMDSWDATLEVIQHAGKAVVTTTLMLFFGFAVMCISSIKPIAYFGVLSGTSLLGGVVCEFLVTPLLLIALYPSKKGLLRERG